MDTSQNHDAGAEQSTRRAALGSLAIVGFVALILIGIATAIYAASFLPKAFSRLSSANVYLSSLVQPTGSDTNQLQAVTPTTPAPTTTNTPTSIPLSPAPATTTPPVTNTYVSPITPLPTTKPATPTYTQPAYRVVTVPATQTYFGLPDLVTTITSVGYLRNQTDTSSYVAANTVPSGYEGAVRFVIANHGTNVSGSWNFDADLPTGDNTSNYHSPYQPSLRPGDSVVFTLGFDNSNRGNETVRIMADNNNSVNESNKNNNDDSATIYFNGTSSYGNGSSSYDSNGNYCRYGTYYQNQRYYCNSSSNSNSNNNQYNSNGDYCSYGTYYQNGYYYCNSNSNTNSNSYDSNGNYCSYGTYYQNGRYYCDTNSGGNNNNYDSNGNYCSYGTYYQNQRYYCN